MTRGSGINNLEGDKANTHHTHHTDNHNEQSNLGPRDGRRLGQTKKEWIAGVWGVGRGMGLALSIDRTKGSIWYSLYPWVMEGNHDTEKSWEENRYYFECSFLTRTFLTKKAECHQELPVCIQIFLIISPFGAFWVSIYKEKLDFPGLLQLILLFLTRFLRERRNAG